MKFKSHLKINDRLLQHGYTLDVSGLYSYWTYSLCRCLCKACIIKIVGVELIYSQDRS